MSYLIQSGIIASARPHDNVSDVEENVRHISGENVDLSENVISALPHQSDHNAEGTPSLDQNRNELSVCPPLDGDSESDSDGFSEVDEAHRYVENFDNLLDQMEYKALILAPGENEQQLSLYRAPDTEYLAFFSIYCGQKPVDNSDRDVP